MATKDLLSVLYYFKPSFVEKERRRFRKQTRKMPCNSVVNYSTMAIALFSATDCLSCLNIYKNQHEKRTTIVKKN